MVGVVQGREFEGAWRLGFCRGDAGGWLENLVGTDNTTPSSGA